MTSLCSCAEGYGPQAMNMYQQMYAGGGTQVVRLPATLEPVLTFLLDDLFKLAVRGTCIFSCGCTADPAASAGGVLAACGTAVRTAAAICAGAAVCAVHGAAGHGAVCSTGYGRI